MVMRITETAGTFNSQIRELKINEVSPLYEDELASITDDVYRFDIPQEGSIRLGLLYNGGHVYVAQEGTNLFLSAHQLNKDPLRSAVLKSFLYKPKGNPKSKELSVDHDAQFVCIPKHLAEGFMIDQEVEWNVIMETAEIERHLRCSIVS